MTTVNIYARQIKTGTCAVIFSLRGWNKPSWRSVNIAGFRSKSCSGNSYSSSNFYFHDRFVPDTKIYFKSLHDVSGIPPVQRSKSVYHLSVFHRPVRNKLIYSSQRRIVTNYTKAQAPYSVKVL
jgi:hypothetical protein